MATLGLFGRIVQVEIGPEGGTGLRLGDLRVGFKVEHKASKTVSTASIRIYNPAPASMALLRAPLAAIRLLVGYEPLSRVIFQGPPVKDGIDLKVEGPDRVLCVDAADGGRGYGQAFVQIGMTTPTTFGQLLNLVLAQTLWSRGFIDPTIEAIVLPHGIAITARPAEVMDRLAAAATPLGADWFVRDNALYVVGKGQTTPEVAPLISSTQGNLLGSPTQTKAGVKLRALIDATMRPGRSIVLQAVGVSGAFVCKEVTFTGDSGFENPFYMDLVCKPVGVP